MSSRDRLVLRAFSLWSVFVWGVLIRNMLKDHTHGAGFRVVHITLAVISISFAVATWMIAARAGRSPRSAPGSSADLEDAGAPRLH
jgi:hypothetical protein